MKRQESMMSQAIPESNKSLIGEIVAKYLLDNGYQGLECIDCNIPWNTHTETCSCLLEELKTTDCINNRCTPLKLYTHKDGTVCRWEEVKDNN